MTLLKTLWADESGQDLVEYVLLIVILALAVGVAVAAFRTQLVTMFNAAATGIQNS